MLATALLMLASAALPPALTPAQRHVLDAIRAVESGGRDAPPDANDGRNIGPYQICLAYWQDAADRDASLRRGSFNDCRDRAYAERVVVAYMRRYCPDAWARCDAEIIARTHFGGPHGPDKPSTAAYWQRVRARLDEPSAR